MLLRIFVLLSSQERGFGARRYSGSCLGTLFFLFLNPSPFDSLFDMAPAMGMGTYALPRRVT